MRAKHVLAATAAILACAAAPAAAEPKLKPRPPQGAIGNVDFVANLPEMRWATAINFLQYRGRDVMLATGRFGLRSYDISDPRTPRFLDAVDNEALRLQGDPPVDTDDSDGKLSTYWQNEDMDVDARRKLVFMARDPRSFTGTTASDTSIAGVYIIDARDPANLGIVTFHQLPTGHTTTCVNDCDYLWTGGPASSVGQKAMGWTGGRPIIVTDIRDPAHPKTDPGKPVDLFRDDGVTAYSHDVQVDGAGVAWVSGQGGVRGYWTDGRHRDPLTGTTRMATATDPIPYAGGELDATTAPSAFMHNAFRPAGRERRDGPRPGYGYDPSDLILATEEADAPPDCDGLAQFSIATLQGSYGGEAWRSTAAQPFRLKTVGTWNPHDQEGTKVDSATSPYCSAHYFDQQDGILAYAWYDQGTRFVDVRDPRHPKQVAYYRPDDGVAWAPYYHRGYVFVADHGRGVDILRLKGRAHEGREVRAPRPSARHRRLVARSMRGLRADPQLGWLCPLPA
jgi:hypothetical protein